MNPQNGTGNAYPRGECTWYADDRYHQLTGFYVPWSGNACDWAAQAAKYGWTVSQAPSVPAIVCFQPGVQTADSTYGHVAIVESIKPDGSFVTSNFNYGLTQAERSSVQNATNHTGAGVSFITAGAPKPNSTQTAVSLKDFLIQVLNSLEQSNVWTALNETFVASGIPQHILNFMIAWAIQECGTLLVQGKTAKWNVLNTTLQETGSTSFNAFGVQNYPDLKTGVQATAKTLANGQYPTLLHALTTNDENGLGFGDNSIAQNIALDLCVWVSGSRKLTASNEQYIRSIMANAGISNPKIRGYSGTDSNLGAANQDKIDQWGQEVVGYSSDVPSNDPVAASVNAITQGFSGMNTFFQNMSNVLANPIRIVEVVGGGVLCIVGCVLFVKGFK